MQCDVIVIGAGIIGLAITYELQKQFPHLSVVVLEKENSFGLHQSSRNSGVIHSGVYYKPGSLKAQNCTAGKESMVQFCTENNVPLEKMGKVIVATSQEEIPYLYELEKRGLSNGVQDVQLIDQEKLKEIEPQCFGLKALWVPHCYSINFRDVVEKLYHHVEQKGAKVLFGQKVEEVQSHEEEVIVNTSSSSYKASFFINCAGLHSDHIASLMLSKKELPFQIIPFRGEYWELKPEKRELVKGLIYPVPNPQFPFLGVHLSRMIDGRVVAGPNAVLAFAKEGYSTFTLNAKECLDYLTYPGFWKMAARYWNIGLYEMYRSLSKKAFVQEVKKLLPAVDEQDFIKGGAGVRAQVVKKDGTLLDDFALHQTKNSLHVLNAPSPAATSSLAIARTICSKIADSLIEIK